MPIDPDVVLSSARAELLTDTEHHLIRHLGVIADVYATEVCAAGPAKDQDVAEFFAHVHALQHALMKQAAARAYPDRYRLAGELIKR